MNLNNFNSQQYERYLSPFGKKVLGNLMNILQERTDCNKIHAPVLNNNSAQKRCVLTFDDSHIPSKINLCEPNVFSDESHNIIVDGDNGGSSNVESPVITILNGFLKTGAENLAGNLNIGDEPRIAKENVAPQTEDCVVRKDMVADSIGETKGYIEWDDIYDKQLLEDLSILESAPNNSLQQNRQEYNEYNLIQLNDECVKDLSNGKHNKASTILSMTKNVSHCADLKTLDVPTISDTLNLPITTATDEEVVVDNSRLLQKTEKTLKNCPNSEEHKGTDIKKRKLKRQNSSKITDSTPKQIKNPPLELKQSFRKQKYTKAVKTWLNSVENEVFDDFMETQNLDEDKQVELQSNNVKRTVQAQLTNKGGIMKYDKPKTKELARTSEVIAPTKNNNTGISTTIVREKKGKPKFIPPIKSQIPVKELSYTIIRFNNDKYFKQHLVELNGVKGEDIDMILIFSNGFCQLNSHYTEDTCTVEGVMFHINNVFYYWKGVFKEFCSTMQLLIKNNTIVCYDGKNLLKYLVSQHSIEVDTTTIAVFDIQIGASLIDPDNTPETFTDVQKMLSFVPEYTIATECVQQKSAWYLTILAECFVKLRALLIDSELWKVFVEIEMRVLPIVAEMELWGVRVDTKRLKAMEEVIVTRLKRTEEACHAAAGRVFQVNSTVQVRSILYDELELDSKSNVRIKETLSKGEKSTSECMLRSLISLHPLPKLILEYRHLHKAHATFLTGISNQVKDGVVRPTWVQTAAATGRIASNNPNLQAIPKAPFSLVLFPPDGKEEENLLAEPNQILNFRSVYVPRDGYTLLAADFKHIECRVFAYAAADTSLLEALASPDLFRVLAARWLNKSEEEVSTADRERTKRIVYASLYGAGTRRLMQILDVSYDQVLSIMASFNRTFPSLKSFGRAVVARCARRGLATLCGRVRRFAHITSDDFALRSHAERQAVNFVVQGSAADLCKLAMAATQRRLRGAAVRARPLLQIHDELVWEVWSEDLAAAAAEIKSAMEGVGAACGMAAALPVAIFSGPSWGDMEEYPPTTQP